MNSKGFTLIEIVMVVVIIGMMAVFVIPTYRTSVNKANERAAINNLMIIHAAQKLKIADGASNYYTGATTALINSNLNLGIIANGISYSCPTATTNSAFSCQAEVAGTFKIKTTEASPATVCCCPSSTCLVAIPPTYAAACSACS